MARLQLQQEPDSYALEVARVKRSHGSLRVPRSNETTGNTAMAMGLLGRKVGMTQIFDEGGNVVPVTVIEAGPCHVLQVRTQERDGYEAVQLGFLDKPRRLASRSRTWSRRQARQQTIQELAPRRASSRCPRPIASRKRFVRELRGSTEGLTVGQTLDVSHSPRSSRSMSSAPPRAAAPPASWCGTISRASEPRTA